MKINIKRNIFLRMILICLIAIHSKSFAQLTSYQISPLQTGHYIPGFINVRDYADPSPISGLIVIDYNDYQYGNKFYGKDGNQVTKITGPGNTSIDLNPDVNGYINAPMVLWASKGKVLGATYFGGLSLPIVTVNANLAYSRIGIIDSIHHSGNISGSVSGISDLSVMPIYLSWGLKNLDLTAGWMVYAPTGKYILGGSDNTGLGFWSNVIQGFAYWYPEKVKGQASKALAIMIGGSFELTSKIVSTDVKPGNRFSLDYGISQYLSNNLEVGVYGGNNWQISQDKGSNVYWDTSVKDKLGVVGFQLGYWVWANRLEAVGKYGWNYSAVQRFEQSMFMLNLIFVTNALTGNSPKKAKSATK
ncbi:MAG TPA: transporter [Puia sp.]|nr:transporter [Puia sp.]